MIVYYETSEIIFRQRLVMVLLFYENLKTDGHRLSSDGHHVKKNPNEDRKNSECSFNSRFFLFWWVFFFYHLYFTQMTLVIYTVDFDMILLIENVRFERVKKRKKFHNNVTALILILCMYVHRLSTNTTK